MRFFKPLAFLALVLVLGVLSNLTAEEKLDLPGAKPESSPAPFETALQSYYPWELPEEAALRDRLTRVAGEIHLDAIEFEQLVDYLREVTGLNIVVNWSALETAAIDKDKEVSLKLMSGTVTYDRVLQLILDEVGGGEVDLSYTLESGVVSISTKEDLARRTHVVLYNVSDILRAAGNRQHWDESMASLVNLLQTTVDPESWREAGGNVGAIVDFSDILVVTQTYQAHEMIWELLAQLRVQLGVPVQGPVTPAVIRQFP